jgi:hypothetical protein
MVFQTVRVVEAGRVELELGIENKKLTDFVIPRRPPRPPFPAMLAQFGSVARRRSARLVGGDPHQGDIRMKPIICRLARLIPFPVTPSGSVIPPVSAANWCTAGPSVAFGTHEVEPELVLPPEAQVRPPGWYPIRLAPDQPEPMRFTIWWDILTDMGRGPARSFGSFLESKV